MEGSMQHYQFKKKILDRYFINCEGMKSKSDLGKTNVEGIFPDTLKD